MRMPSGCIRLLLIWCHLKCMETEEVSDSWYDQVNEYLLEVYNWETDQPNVTPELEKVKLEDWHWAYNGSLSSINRYPRRMVEEQRAIVWGFGLRGFDSYGRVYPDSYCMGVLVHPEILMTLCACVNSWTRSFRNLKLEEATDDVFKVSDTSDVEFDIRAATLFALRTTWVGWKNLTGDQDYFPILRQVIQYPPCMDAIDASDNITIAFKQVKTVAFLQLSTPATHPFPKLTPFKDYEYWSKGYYDVHEYANKLNVPKTVDRPTLTKYDAYSYFQYPKEIREDNRIVQILPKSKATDGTPAPVDMSRQLVGLGVQEVKVNIKTLDTGLGICPFRMYSRYQELLDIIKDEDEVRNLFKSWLQGPAEVACFRRFSTPPLCDVAPGSPVVTGGKLYGIVMARQTDCKNADEEFPVWVLMFSEDGIGTDVEVAIKGIVGELVEQRRREKEALENPLILSEEDKSKVDFAGHLDGEIVPVLAKVLQEGYVRTIEPVVPADPEESHEGSDEDSRFEAGADIYYEAHARSGASWLLTTSISVPFVHFGTSILFSMKAVPVLSL